jgi:hypothetical protein
VSLTATRTITLAPDDSKKIWIVENATTGSQALTFKQGSSGSTVTVSNGNTAMIYADGAGATNGAITNAFTDLQLAGTTSVAGLDAGSGSITTTGTVTGTTLAGTLSTAAQTNITSVGALDGGSITSGFGSIDVGSSAITTTGTVTGNTLAGTLSTAAQPNITSVGTLTGFTSTGIDDNATSTAITIDSSENVGIGNASPQVNFVVGDGTNGTGLEVTPNESSGYVNMNAYDRGSSAWRTMNIGGDVVTLNTGGTERARITSAGNVGIGTSSPAVALEVHKNDSSSPVFELKNTNAAGYSGLHLRSYSDILVGHLGYANASVGGSLADEVFFGSISATPVVFTTSDNERMRILSNGAIGMGFASQISGATLSVFSSADGGVVIGSSGGANAFRKIYHDPTSGILYFTSSGNAPYLSNAGSWVSASDIAIKKDIEDIDYGLETVKSLQPRRYKMKDTEEKQVGFVAQEIEQIVPEVVSGEDGKKGVSYGQITPLLVKAIQEQQTIIESLEARITALES